MRNQGKKYEPSNSKKQSTRATFSDMLGIGRIISSGDTTGNVRHPPQEVPPRTKLPGRGEPAESLDRFSPGVEDNDYDWELSDDSDLATPQEIEDPEVERNSQRNLVEDCPSTLDPTRFVHQNRGGKRG